MKDGLRDAAATVNAAWKAADLFFRDRVPREARSVCHRRGRSRGGRRIGRVIIACTAAALLLPAFGVAADAISFRFDVFDIPGQQATYAFGINDVGVIACDGGGAFAGRIGAFMPLRVANSSLTRSYGVNRAGQLVGFFKDGAGFHGFMGQAGAFGTIDKPGAESTFAFGINDAGEVVGTYDTAGGAYGYRYAGGTFTTISVPAAIVAPGSGTQAHGINNHGDVVGFFNEGVDAVSGRRSVAAFAVRAGNVSIFSVPGSSATEANGINDAGTIVGTYRSATGGRGFLYADGVFTTFAVPGAAKTEAQGINNAGQIVGWVETSGSRRGFSATPLAEPATPRR